MTSPFLIPPHPRAQEAAREVMQRVHSYMDAHPESELHRQGKMFGVLVVEGQKDYLSAFSAKLDGSYEHEGFVPPVSDTMKLDPVGHTKIESRRLQRLLFEQCELVNGKGERRSLLSVFSNEKSILSPEEWFAKGQKDKGQNIKEECTLPPSGAGDCCAPKLLQYALTHGLKPLYMAEFWIGVPSKTEIRKEGAFYAPCSGKCVPILRFMLDGIDVEQMPEEKQVQALCQQIETLYEDDYLMVINKPSGLLSVPGKSEETSAESYLLQRHHLPFLKAVHRLDQDTSGILVMAKTAEVYKTMQAYFQRRDILKRYEALVELSSPNQATVGIIDLPLLPNPLDRPRQMVDHAHGKPAITRYCIRERRENNIALVDFYPLTGRTHQLRVHAAHPEGLNAPIVGDRLYGKGQGERLMLHAAEIVFTHPITQKDMKFCISIPF